MNLFGRKKAQGSGGGGGGGGGGAGGPRLDDAINSLRSTQQMLDKRREHLDGEILDTKRLAKAKLQAKDKRGAISMLKRAKAMEMQRDQLYGKIENLDTQILTLQAAIGNQEVFAAMKQGHEALRQATKQTNADNVADMMEDIAESLADVDEVNQAFSQSIGTPMDEDELTQELDAMEQELMDEQLLAAPDIAPIANPRATTTTTTTTTNAAAAITNTSTASPATITATTSSSAAAIKNASAVSEIDRIAQSLPAVPTTTRSSATAAAAAASVPAQTALSDRESQELRELEAAMQL